MAIIIQKYFPLLFEDNSGLLRPNQNFFFFKK